MKKALLLGLLFVFTGSVWAKPIACPDTKKQVIPQNTTVFFYQRFKNHKALYVPVLLMKDGKLSGVGKMLMPEEVTIFNLQDDKPINVHFTADYNPMENTCQSIGEAKVSVVKQASSGQLYASSAMSNVFNFNPDKAMRAHFLPTVKKPCKPGQAHYDKNGIAQCDADTLIATSNLINEQQYWQTHQYRYDMGLRISAWDEKAQQFKLIVDDCTFCSD